MAIGNAAIELLIQLRTAGYLKPGSAVAEIGAQQISRSLLSALDRVAYLGSLFGIHRPLPFAATALQSEPNEDWDVLTAPFARELWRWLGFEYAAIDIDNSPDCIALDLNFDAVPPGAKGKYALVTNFGTTEHVPNQLNAFNIVHDLTAPNGIMIHEVPAQGMFNHGIVNYNFKFFWLLARSNGYELVHADFLSAKSSTDFPNNVEEFLNASKLATARQAPDYKAVDAGWLVVLQKSLDMEFVPPIDVNTGMSTDMEALKKRYWTVFEPDRFEEFQAQAAAANAKRGMAAPASQASPSRALMAPLSAANTSDAKASNGKVPSASQTAPSTGTWGLGVVMKLFRIMKRLVHNSDSAAHNLIRTASSAEATTAGIANQSDMIRRKLDALTRVMYELREIQKAQLGMQRQAAEMIRQLAASPPKPGATGKEPGDG